MEDIKSLETISDERKQSFILYTSSSKDIKIEVFLQNKTIWLTQKMMAELFNVDVRTVNEHLKNIFKSSELKKNSVVRKIRITAKDGKLYKTQFYNLDAIISVGYRVNSLRATEFRKWATKVLRHHIMDGYTINRSRIGKNYKAFLDAVEEVKTLLPSDCAIDAVNAIELIKMFAETWLSLDAYDKFSLPTTGVSRKQVEFVAEELIEALDELKTNIFGTEQRRQSFAGIVGNIFQTFDKEDLYPTVEEKAAHLLYFIVKDHPFVDGNKRSGAFSFVWFLKRVELLNPSRLTPEALTALTLLVAESDPKEKSRMIGLVLMMLGGKNL